MNIIILILLSIIELITWRTWFVCQRFNDIFHYSAINISYQVDTSTNAFEGMPTQLVRLFHNKLIQISIDSLRLYFQFWDVRFESNWLSIIGYFSIFAGFYYIISNKKKKIYHWLALTLLAVLPCIEIFINPPISLFLKSIYLWLPFCLFSLYGIYQFVTHGNRKKRVILVFILLILSIWWLWILPHTIVNYCKLPPEPLRMKK